MRYLQMRYLQRFVGFLICLMSVQLLGCFERVDVAMTDIIQAEKITAETDVFETLLDEFDGRLGNPGDFTGLRTVTTSETYLAFLSERYPTEMPVHTLEEYFQVAPPDPEKYIPFLEKWGVAAPTPEDIAVIHSMTVDSREGRFRLFNDKPVFGQDEQDFVRAFMQIITAGPDFFSDPAIEEFLIQHQLLQSFVAFSSDLREFTTETEVADATWFHGQIEIHGRDPGLLWCAIQNPALVGEILQNFQSTDIFWEWVAATRR